MSTNVNTTGLVTDSGIELGDDILDIRPPVDIPTGWEWLLWGLGVLAVLALAWFLIKRLLNRPRAILPPPVPYVAPHILARRRLEQALKWIDDPYRFCTAVSDALRGYVEGRFSIHAPDRTTEEFLNELRNESALKTVHQEQIAEFLDACDLVKFAREEPARLELEHMHSLVARLVEETKDDGLAEEKKEVAS